MRTPNPLKALRPLAAVAALFVLAGGAHAEKPHEREHHGEFRGREWAYDQRYAHNHFYPARGYVVAGLPAGAVGITFSGGRYWYQGGVWFRPSGPKFVVVAPPIGVVVPLLPPSFVTLWVGPVPYYYANSAYYTPVAGGYRVVDPPPNIEASAPPPPPAAGTHPELVIYPRNGQSAQQTEADRTACAQWATAQATGKAADVYMRAMTACMDGRGYNVR